MFHYYALVAHSSRVKTVLWDKTTSKIKGYHNPIRAHGPGQIFFMDYGFIPGKDTTHIDDGPLVTSKDDYNCYMIIS